MTPKNKNLLTWVIKVAELTKPDNVEWITGSEEEYTKICNLLVAKGDFIPLNNSLYPNCFLARSKPSDVARVEDRTFICSKSEKNSGPTNNWHEPADMYRMLNGILSGSMKGKTMYVVPYLMGPVGSKYSKVGFELTDSPYVVANMRIMARVGDVALKHLESDFFSEETNDFVRGIHSVCTLNPEELYVAHFPEDKTIISVNSNYGGNALQGKKCFALRIASSIARNEGWLAEHMLILGITTPKNKKHYIVAAFPSSCGKTNLAMMKPPKEWLDQGYKIETVGDDIAWLNVGDDGRLYAINPEYGFFGVAPGTSETTNPNALSCTKQNSIFTNVALNPKEMTPWWEGLTETPPANLIDWMGHDWTIESGTKAAHPNSRFTSPASQCPCIDPDWQSPNGVPISAIIFGGRRSKTAPLVIETNSWEEGVYFGSVMSSETTSAAAGVVGKLRRDPMAMLPFIGYHIGDYLAHWLSFADRKQNGKYLNLPKIFHVNWFRRDSNNQFLWPGFGENIRVLDWIIKRIVGEVEGEKTLLGKAPKLTDIDLKGLKMSPESISELFSINKEEWLNEIESQRDFFKKLGEKLPKSIEKTLNKLEQAFLKAK